MAAIGIPPTQSVQKKGMFGEPVPTEEPEKVFNLVWTFVIKELDICKKSRCILNGSARSDKVPILDHTAINCVYHTRDCIFYGSSAVENMIIFAADISNIFGEALPLK